jgi:hypothetical protein
MRAALFTAALLLAAACTVDGESTTPAGTCLALADVTCAKLTECYGPEVLEAAGVPATPEECVAATRAELESGSRTEETACPAGLTYDPVMAASCLAENRALTCEAMEGRRKDHVPSCSQVCR